MTLSSPTTYLQKGQPYDVTLSLSEAVSSPLTMSLAYGGSASPGTDYTVPGGNIVVPAGQTALEVRHPDRHQRHGRSEPRADRVVGCRARAYQVGKASSLSVTITSSVLPTLTITSNMSTVAQGGAATFTITADQAPAMDTSVNFSVQGTAVPGQNYVPLVGTALLKAGRTQVTVVLQSLETNVDVRAHGHDRRPMADPGRPGLREGRGHGGAG